ncbi:MAG: ATP-binding cassette domain-containing protein [Cytophagales bacterium]|nr:ATP-binding cassette domain-containing protein [Cytophagales bacterium]
MSEEILKALMQLFAIITKQDEGASAKEKAFIERFLKQQLSAEMVTAYFSLYESFLTEKESEGADEEAKKKKLTSVKDSVRTLSICKKINKTLTQKQKIIVLIRLFELISQEPTETEAKKNQRREIINTVATVFNIEKDEFEKIELFCQVTDFSALINDPEYLLVHRQLQAIENGAKIINSEMDGSIAFLHITTEDMYFLRYQGQAIIQLNGIPVNTDSVYLFAYGSTIKMPHGEPIYFSDIYSKYLKDSNIAQISFEASEVEYKFPNGALGLRDVNIYEGAGKLIAIMGGSGAGKTTLLNVLAGLEKPSEGEIKINGLDIFKDKNKVEGIVGYVAQDDILFEELSVYENLYFNAKLCFKDYTETQLDEAVNKTLKSLGLFEIKDIKVGNVLNKKISGGQRKRLNIALELIREPAIMFLDEPTSGLSSRDSENVIDLLKELTLKGKLIFVVIHQPSSDIYKMFDKVIILDVGGYQIYYGNPVNAVSYFKKLTNQLNADEGQCHHCGNVNPESIFNTIDAKVVDEYGNTTENRKISAKTWNEYFKILQKPQKVEQIQTLPPSNLNLPSKITQYIVFTTRDLLSKISNSQYMLINFLEAPLLGFILSFIIRYIDDPKSDNYYFGQNENIPAYIFMSAIVALFMGLTVSAEEIIRDAKIRKREKFLNLSKGSYIFSKITILFTLSAIQTFLFTLIGNNILGIKDMTFTYWLVLFSLSCTANVLGLNISSTFNSAVTIYILIPLLLIPQMILSGAIFSFDKLNRFLTTKDKVPFVADMMASRWAFEALAVSQFKDNKFEALFYDYERQESHYDYKSVYWAPKLINKLEECRHLLEHTPIDTASLNADKILIKNELTKEIAQNPKLQFDPSDMSAALDKFDKRSIEYLRNSVEIIKNYYTSEYNKVNAKKDMVLNNFMATDRTAAIFQETKHDYYNESLADLVKNQKSKNKIIEYDDKLLQIKDPIFNIPTKPQNPFAYNTHLYAPVKYYLGITFDTFWFNVIIIWIMTAILTVTLYFDTFRKLLSINIHSILKINFKNKK